MSEYFAIPKNKIVEIPVELTNEYLNLDTTIPCVTVASNIWTLLLSGFSLHDSKGKLIQDNCQLVSYIVENINNESVMISYYKKVL